MQAVFIQNTTEPFAKNLLHVNYTVKHLKNIGNARNNKTRSNKPYKDTLRINTHSTTDSQASELKIIIIITRRSRTSVADKKKKKKKILFAFSVIDL